MVKLDNKGGIFSLLQKDKRQEKNTQQPNNIEFVEKDTKRVLNEKIIDDENESLNSNSVQQLANPIVDDGLTEDERAAKAVIESEDSIIKDYISEESKITDISFNGTDLWVKDNEKGAYRPAKQPSAQKVANFIKKIANTQHQQFTPSEPILDTEIGNLRVNAMDKAISPSGTTFAIRISKPRLAIKNISEIADKDVEQLIKVLIECGYNFVIAGKTGAGKTELQKLMARFINNKVTLIEDTMDSHIKKLYPEKDINSWRTLMSPTRENKIDISLLNKAALRNNPDWIIIAETRGWEMYHLLQSAMTDHSIITTLHSKGAKMIPKRVIQMISEKYNMNEKLLGQTIVDVLRFGIYMWVEENDNGQTIRFMRELYEFTAYTDEGIHFNRLYERKNSYDEENNTYIENIVKEPLSEMVLEDLMFKRKYHELPEVYRKKKAEVN